DGIVDDLEDEVVKASIRGIANVHPRAFPHRFEALENPDRLRSVPQFRSIGLFQRLSSKKGLFTPGQHPGGSTQNLRGNPKKVKESQGFKIVLYRFWKSAELGGISRYL